MTQSKGLQVREEENVSKGLREAGKQQQNFFLKKAPQELWNSPRFVLYWLWEAGKYLLSVLAEKKIYILYHYIK